MNPRLHNWKYLGFDDGRQKHRWRCSQCLIEAHLVTPPERLVLPPQFRSTIQPCDEKTVELVMKS